nr:hypothetical protein [uncultured bacterium]
MSAPFTGPLCRAARALVQWPRRKLADEAGVAEETIRLFETGAADPGAEVKARLETALTHAGAVFIPEDTFGVGVRLKFTQKDVRAINRLEDEGGAVGEDDV